MSTTMSTLTHQQGKKHQRLLALQDVHKMEQTVIEKGSLPALKSPVSILPYYSLLQSLCVCTTLKVQLVLKNNSLPQVTY